MQKSLQELYPKRIDVVLFLVAATLLLIIGLSLPVLTVRQLWATQTYSILSGIINLWREKYYVLAGVIFFFSVVFPITKIGALYVIWLIRLTDHQRQLMLRWLEALGRWSMLDVFVAAIIIVSVRSGLLASAKAEKGIYFFGASILLAMIVTNLQNHLARRSEII